MEFLLLGPLEVRRGGDVVEVRGAKRRTLLAMLVLHANEVVRTDRLVEELWGEHPPGSAAAALQSHVSRLRKDLGEDVVGTKPWGYVLRADPQTIDVRRFEALVAEARTLPAEGRGIALRTALALWRGPPLADLANEPALADHIAHLQELRLSALEQRIDADLETGAHAELVPELENLVARQPLRERLRGQLILALYRAGRQAEALETYRETRRVLIDELGIEPSPELRELERAILRQDPALTVAPSAHAPTPPDDRGRWRWPRSPLVTAAALVLVAAVGGLAAVLVTRDAPTEVVAATSSAVAEDLIAATTTPVAATTETPENEQPGQPKTPRPKQGRLVDAPRRRAATEPNSSASGSATRIPRPRTASRRRSGSPSTRPGQTTTSASSPSGSQRPPKPAPPSTTTTVPSTPSDPQQAPTLADRTAWWTGLNQPQLSITREDGNVTVIVSREASDGFNATITTRCRIVGDFDAQVRFQLVEWSGATGVWVSLMASDLGGVNAYRTDAFGETYGVYIPPSGGTSVPAAGNTGALRLTRQRSTITGFYLAGKDWITIFAGRGPTADTGMNVSVFNLPDVAPFGGRPATVRFSDFKLTAQTLNC